MVIDIVLGIIILIFAIVGLKKGFIESVLSLFGTLVSLALAIVACKPMANFIEKTFKITSKIGEFMLEQLTKAGGEIFTTAISAETVEAGKATASNIIEGSTLQSIVKIVLKAISGDKSFVAGDIPGNYIANTLAGVIILIGSVIITFILIRLTVWILTKIFDKLLQNRALSGIDRFLGLVFGLAKATLFISILFIGATFALSTGIGPTIQKQINQTTVTKQVFEPAKEFIVEKIGDIDFNKIVGGFFNSSNN